jgi:hypothetical protein
MTGCEATRPGAQTCSTQGERDYLLGGQRRAFRPFQFKYGIAKLSAQSRHSILIFFLIDLLDGRSNANPQGLSRREELNRSFVALFNFVNVSDKFK